MPTKHDTPSFHPHRQSQMRTVKSLQNSPPSNLPAPAHHSLVPTELPTSFHKRPCSTLRFSSENLLSDLWQCPRLLTNNDFGNFIKQNSSRNVEVEEPRYNKGKHHTRKKKVEKSVPLPKPPRLVVCCLTSSSVAWFVPLVHEVRITKTCHVACGWATYFADPKTMKERMDTLKMELCLYQYNTLWIFYVI
jgi:hypothetical protein